jgi:2-methylisocitrate lyase-like PEP mutase family enzyme
MMPSQADRAQRFVELHEGPGAFVIPNPWDVGTARILAGLGVQALATTSAGHAFSLGRRDGGVSREEALEHARTIVEATPLPVSADFENGFGDAPAFVAETIRMAAGVGLAGASIEDATGRSDAPIYERAQAVERVAAAVEAARACDRPCVLTARAENFLHGRPDLDDTIARLPAFEAAGADVRYAPGLRDLDTIGRVCAALSRPVNVLVGIPGAAFPVEQLAQAGVRRISLGAALSKLALSAVIRAAREMQQGTFGFVDDALSTAEIAAFMAPRSS